MGDHHAFKVISLFTYGSKLRCSSEIVCLAAHTWHRFFLRCSSGSTNITAHDTNAYLAACLILACRHYEQPMEIRDVVNVIIASIHQPKNFLLDVDDMKLLEQTIINATEVLLRVIDYKVGYILVTGPENQHDTIGAIGATSRSTSTKPIISDAQKSTISPHRYMTHYLDSLCDLLNDKALTKKFCNVAWIYLCDFYWTPKVVQHKQEYLACASIEMALKTLKIALPTSEKSSDASRKWYNIFCDDLTEQILDKLILTMINEYSQLDDLIENETSVFTESFHSR